MKHPLGGSQGAFFVYRGLPQRAERPDSPRAGLRSLGGLAPREGAVLLVGAMGREDCQRPVFLVKCFGYSNVFYNLPLVIFRQYCYTFNRPFPRESQASPRQKGTQERKSLSWQTVLF